jgi:hypothetical protein
MVTDALKDRQLTAQRNALAALLEIPFGLDIRCGGRGWSDCGASEADVSAPNDAGRKDNKHVDTKSPSDGEMVRGTMARIASKHLATLHCVKGGIYLRQSEPPPPQRIVSLDGD